MKGNITQNHRFHKYTYTYIYACIYTFNSVYICTHVYIYPVALEQCEFELLESLIYGYFSVINTTALNVCGWLNLGYGGEEMNMLDMS